jgi:hypothetical protein
MHFPHRSYPYLALGKGEGRSSPSLYPLKQLSINTYQYQYVKPYYMLALHIIRCAVFRE